MLHLLLHSAAVAGLSAMLFSCSPHCRQWNFDEIRTSCPHYNSKRMVLPPDNPFRGVELVISQTHSGQRMYLNVFSLSLPCDPEIPEKTKFTLTCFSHNILNKAMLANSTIDDSEPLNACGKQELEGGLICYQFYAERLEGGQRLSLPEEAIDVIITELLEGRIFTLSIGRFSSEIIPFKFYEAYRKMR
jgi:hypothetical protein